MGLILFVARFSDVITDPIIGILSDNTQTKIGRRKPWILFGCVPMIIMTYLLFAPPDEASMGYFAACIILTYLFFTVVQIPFDCWGAEISGDYNTRSTITTTRQVFTFSGFLIASLIPVIAMYLLGINELRVQLFYVALSICIIMPIVVILATVFVPEPKVRTESTKRFSIKEYRDGLKFMKRNGPFMRILIGYTGTIVGTSIDSVVSYFFCKHVLLAESSYMIALVFMMIAAIVCLPGWLYLSKKIGKHRTFVISIFWYVSCALLMPLLYFVPESSGVGFVVLQALKGVCAGAIGAMSMSMCADAVDIDTIRSGETRTGFYFAIWGAAQKTAAAFAGFIGLAAISLFGFDATLEPGLAAEAGGNKGFALFGIVLLYTVIPCCFYLATLPWIWNYPLTEQRQIKLRERLEYRLSKTGSGPDHTSGSSQQTKA